jgi:hypothetical protein
MEKPGGLLHHQTPAPWPLGKMQTTRWAKQHRVLPQTTLGQISIASCTDWPPPGEKRKKNLNNKEQQQKRHIAKRGRPDAEGGGGAIHPRTVNKQATRRRPEWRHLNSNQDLESL